VIYRSISVDVYRFGWMTNPHMFKAVRTCKTKLMLQLKLAAFLQYMWMPAILLLLLLNLNVMTTL